MRCLPGKLEHDPTEPQRLKSVRGVGYMFTG
jgi:DNA-binding response OmpR family regulator